MTREWKPGDSAFAYISWRDQSGRSGGSAIAMRCSRDYNESHWRTQTFGEIPDHKVTDIRPLVVIDPEDREQVERLSARIAAAECGDGMAPVDAVQAALRSLIEPPKCKAALIVKGEHFACDQHEGHAMTHSNVAAGAIWGESE